MVRQKLDRGVVIRVASKDGAGPAQALVVAAVREHPPGDFRSQLVVSGARHERAPQGKQIRMVALVTLEEFQVAARAGLVPERQREPGSARKAIQYRMDRSEARGRARPRRRARPRAISRDALPFSTRASSGTTA